MSMATIGERLKEAREKKALTIEQVQKQTLIHTSVIAALEEGKCDDVLTPTYVKSFLKKYSNYLGLDSKELLNEYASLHPDSPVFVRDLNKSSNVTPKRGDSKGPGLFVRRLVFSIAALLAAALFLFLAFSGIRFLYSVSKKAHRAGKAATKTAGNKAERALRPAKNAQKNSPQLSKSAVPKNAPLNIVLKVRAPVWVELKRDGEKIFHRVLPKGLEETLTAREKVDLYIANGDVIEIFLNGKSLGSPGKGVIRDLEITRSGMKIK